MNMETKYCAYNQDRICNSAGFMFIEKIDLSSHAISKAKQKCQLCGEEWFYGEQTPICDNQDQERYIIQLPEIHKELSLAPKCGICNNTKYEIAYFLERNPSKVLTWFILARVYLSNKQFIYKKEIFYKDLTIDTIKHHIKRIQQATQQAIDVL